MNEPGPDDPDLEPFPEAASGSPFEPFGQARPNWVELVRPWLKFLALLLPIAAVLAAGLPFGGWLSLPTVLHRTDPRTLIPGMELNLEPLATAMPRWIVTAVFAAAIGALTWIWRGGTAGFGFFAATAAFSLSMAIEIGRWFKPGQLPDFRDPLLAALVAAAVWRLSRFAPDQPVTPLPRHTAWGIRRRVVLGFAAAGFGIILAIGAACIVPAINWVGYAPGQIADHISTMPEGRVGMSALITGAISGTFEELGVTHWLRTANALDAPDDMKLPTWVGADEAHDGVLPPGRLRSVNTIEMLRQAIDSAAPGDVILLQPGVYRISGNYLKLRQPGTADAPITLRAPRLGLATLESDQAEAVNVAAPYWHFENLVLRGVCGDDTACDNGFHIVGEARSTVLSNVRVEDFNAQIKINGEYGKFPDGGRLDHVSLIDTHGRKTASPVTPIDLVAANGWVIQNSLIADFVKVGGNAVSYGAFAKGASRGTVFTRDVVLCQWRLRAAGSQSIGLSFGGGGTEPALTRDGGRSGYEHADGVMADNLIAFCSDDGIYLNRAANSVVRHNTLIGTSGIDARFVETTADLEGNVVDGAIRARDGALFWGEGNEAGTLTGMFLGRNPVRALFVDPARFDLRWRRLPVLVKPDPGVDLCGAAWTDPAPAGAFQDFRTCGGAEKSSLGQ
jgi:hypothetical protein